MSRNERPGLFARGWTAIRRSILGKSDPTYLAQLAGDDQYWEEAIAAQLGWPGHQPGSPTHPGTDLLDPALGPAVGRTLVHGAPASAAISASIRTVNDSHL
jgi:hypothetical protein